MTTTKIKVTRDFIDYRDGRARLFSKGEPTSEGFARADCELYEYHMIRENLWGETKTWASDGVSDKYGRVDVKFIEKWWNLPLKKAWNVFRQIKEVDHFYFVEKVSWPSGPLLEGDEVEIGFIGVMTYQEVASKVEISKIPGYGYYVDVRKHAHG